MKTIKLLLENRVVITWKAGREKTIKKVKEPKTSWVVPGILSRLYSAREAEAKLECSQSYSIFLLVPSSPRVL